MLTEKKTITKVTDKHKKRHFDQLVIEKQTVITLNEKEIATINHSSQLEKECAVGYALCHHNINATEANIVYKPGKCTIQAETSPLTAIKHSSFKNIQPIDVFQLTAYFQESALLFKQTAVSESAAIASKQSLLINAEDLSQENALYKVIGKAALTGLNDFSQYTLLFSSKIDLKLMTILDRFGFPIIITRTAPTKQALDLANKAHIKIIGFARGRKFNAYN